MQVANGVTTVYSFPFGMLDPAYSLVILQNIATGGQTIKTLNTDYAVTLNSGTEGGTITFNTAPASGNNVIIGRSTPPDQLIPLATSSGFQALTVMNMFDKVTAAMQEVINQAKLFISFPTGSTCTNAQYPTPVDGMALVWNGTNGNIRNSSTNIDTVISSVQASATNAATSATNAASSASTASAAANNASASATSATNAAASSVNNASTATTQASSATTSATAAANSATSAASSATSASNSATSATTSATTATTQASNASNSASSASTSATNATSSANSASTSAGTASTQASNASSSAITAATQATNASNSATLAQNWASQSTGLVGGVDYSAKYYASQASTNASTATTQASNASTSATNANNSAISASGSATTATNQATAAGTSATNASNSASTATTQAGNASTSASSAATSASSASSSATAAAASAVTAQSVAQGGVVPYTVKTGAVNATGQANALSSLSNSSIKLAAAAVPIVLAQSDGTVENITTSDQTITGLTDGPYLFLKLKGNNTIVPFGTPIAVSTSNLLMDFKSSLTSDYFANTINLVGSGASLSGNQFVSGTNTGLNTTTLSNFGSGNWTIEGRFTFNSFSNSPIIIASMNHYGHAITINTNGTLSMNISSNNGSWNVCATGGGISTLATGTQYHIALQFDGSYYKLFVNGVLDQCFSSTLTTSATGGLGFGYYPTNPTVACLNGKMQDLRVTTGTVRYTGTGTTTGTNYFTPPVAGSISHSINNFTEGYIAPTSPNINDIFVNLGVSPIVAQQWNGSAWVAYPFTKIGEVTIASGIMGTPITYAYNGCAYVSVATTNGNTATINHNLGTSDILVEVIENGVNMAKNITITNNTASWMSSYTGTSYAIIRRAYL